MGESCQESSPSLTNTLCTDRGSFKQDLKKYFNFLFYRCGREKGHEKST